ncbi:MAG: NHL repeat-containing protein [Candidatus Hodarchaeota archaeon]
MSLPSGYDRPSGIAVDSAGDVYVATRNYILLPNEYDIHKFDSSAATWTTWNTPSNPLTVLNDPRGLSVQYDLDGNIYICVADTYNDRILRFTTDGVYHDGWGSSGTGGGRFDLPFGIASDSDGNVYVADTENHRIQKFSLDPVALLQALVEKVLELDVKQGIMTSLDAKLENALDSLDAANADQRQDAINKLEAFKNAVEAQRDKELTSLQADELIAAADAIIALLQL